VRSFLLVTLFAFVGCSTLNVDVVELPIEKVGTAPLLGEKATAPVGGVVFSQFKYLSKLRYTVTAGASIGLGLGKVVVSPLDSLITANLDGQKVYCTEKPAYIDPIAGPIRTACFIDANGDGAFETVKAAPGAVWFTKGVSPPLAYERSEQMVPRTDSFKYEILYQGTSRNSLKLLYREYIDNLARPAFFQDVTYDLDSMPTTVTFRTVRIEVLDANNNEIVYRVLSGF